jgi:hypothetical protein
MDILVALVVVTRQVDLDRWHTLVDDADDGRDAKGIECRKRGGRGRRSGAREIGVKCVWASREKEGGRAAESARRRRCERSLEVLGVDVCRGGPKMSKGSRAVRRGSGPKAGRGIQMS